MRLSKLYINEDIFCDFKKGLNIIIAKNYTKTNNDKSNILDTNGVGKSLIINIIKRILGGEKEKQLTFKYFPKKKVSAFLELYDDEKKQHWVICYFFLTRIESYRGVFKGSLEKLKSTSFFKKRKSIINENDFLNYKDEIQFLNKKKFAFFISQNENIDISSNPDLTYASLLDFIIRSEKYGYSDIIARVKRKQWVQYRAIQYLFGFIASAEQKICNLKQEKNKLELEMETKKSELKSKGLNTQSKLDNHKIRIEKKLKEIKKNKEILKVSSTIEDTRQKYKKERETLIKLNNTITKQEIQIDNYIKNLEILKEKEKSLAEFLNLEKFYNDLVGVFPDQIKINIDQFKNFVNGMTKDRSRYFEEKISDIKLDLTMKKKERVRALNTVNSLSSQLSTLEITEDISLLIKNEETLENELREIDEFQIYFDEIEDNLKKRISQKECSIDKILKELKEFEQTHKERTKKIIELFQDIVSKIYDNDESSLNFNLIKEKEKSTLGRTEIECSIPSDSSKGRTHAKICLFDFTWFLFDNPDYNPDFLIHDGPYSDISSSKIKENMLNFMIEKLKDSNKQYIITINENELINNNIYEDYFIKELNGNNIEGKFFKEQFDE